MQVQSTSVRAGQPGVLESAVIRSLSYGELAVAVNAADIPFGVSTSADIDDDKIIALVIQGVERLGLRKVRELAARSRSAVRAADRRLYRRIWGSSRRAQVAVNLANRVSLSSFYRAAVA